MVLSWANLLPQQGSGVGLPPSSGNLDQEPIGQGKTCRLSGLATHWLCDHQQGTSAL